MGKCGVRMSVEHLAAKTHSLGERDVKRKTQRQRERERIKLYSTDIHLLDLHAPFVSVSG